jgi:cell division protein FtsB
MKWLAAALLCVVVLLQYRLWISENGVRGLLPLEAAVAARRAENDRLEQRNRELGAEVHDLKNGTAALEEQARSDLGMIGPNETFYQVVPRAAGSAGRSQTAQR